LDLAGGPLTLIDLESLIPISMCVALVLATACRREHESRASAGAFLKDRRAEPKRAIIDLCPGGFERASTADRASQERS
jgi:hypothetical protein